MPASLNLHTPWAIRKIQRGRLSPTESHCFGKLSDTFISILREEKEKARVIEVAELYDLNTYAMNRINSLFVICVYLNFTLLI